MDDKEVAKWIIKQFYSVIWGLDYEGLGKDLAVRVKEFPGIVYLVFVELQEQEFDSSTIIYVARNFFDNANQSILNYIGKTTDGNILLAKVKAILKCDLADNKSAGRCVNIDAALITNNGEAKPAHKAEDTAQPRKLSDAEINVFVERGQNQKLWKRKGRFVSRHLYDPEICWDLPTDGTGFTTYRIDDMKRASLGETKYGYDQIGTKETIEAMMRIAEQWAVLPLNKNPVRKLEYGDISRPGGINTPDHGTHMTGKAFDMRLIRKGESNGIGFTYKEGIYSQTLTKAFILMVIDLYSGTTFYFNDAELNDKDAATKNFVDPSDISHDNHLHVMFQGGRE